MSQQSVRTCVNLKLLNSNGLTIIGPDVKPKSRHPDASIRRKPDVNTVSLWGKQCVTRCVSTFPTGLYKIQETLSPPAHIYVPYGSLQDTISKIAISGFSCEWIKKKTFVNFTISQRVLSKLISKEYFECFDSSVCSNGIFLWQFSKPKLFYSSKLKIQSNSLINFFWRFGQMCCWKCPGGQTK